MISAYFCFLYDFPLDLLRKIQPHVLNTTNSENTYDIFTFLILYENPTTRETIFLAKINLMTYLSYILQRFVTKVVGT